MGAALFLASALPRTPAQVPPAEQFLPDDLTAMATIPDWPKFSSLQASSSWGRLWSDPALKAFREKFTTRFKESVTDPLERDLGIKFADYAELLQGQLTFALTPPPEGSGDTFGLLAVLDAKDKADVLTTRLADAKKRWTEAGREIRTEKLRETEFAVVTLAQKDVAALLARIIPGANPDAATPEEGKGKPVYLGQVKSLLIVGENPKTIEKILARLSGTDVPNLADLGDFQKGRTAVFRDTLAAGWLRVGPIVANLMPQARVAVSPLPTEAILAASGLTSLKSIAVNLSGTPEGESLETFLQMPEAARTGLFKALGWEKKDATPPPFVPADASEFTRIRIPLARAWGVIESTVGKIDPNMAGLLQILISTVETAGKEKNPDFSFRKNFVENLGDDLIVYQKQIKGAKASPAGPPQLVLIGSPQPAQLVETIRVIGMLSPTEGPKDREFLGKKIYALNMPAMSGPREGADNEEAPAAQSLSFTSSGGYVALTTTPALLEEFLRAGDASEKPLRDASGLSASIQKAGGGEGGLFIYENQKETARAVFEAFKEDPSNLGFYGLLIPPDAEEEITEWLDPSLLPPFEQVAKYFHITLTTGRISAEGWHFNVFTPTPPGL